VPIWGPLLFDKFEIKSKAMISLDKGGEEKTSRMFSFPPLRLSPSQPLSHLLDASTPYLSLPYQSPAPLPKRTKFFYQKINLAISSACACPRGVNQALVPYLNVCPCPLLGKKKKREKTSGRCVHLYGLRRASTAPAPHASKSRRGWTHDRPKLVAQVPFLPLPCQGAKGLERK
jgi:hypothetical protein